MMNCPPVWDLGLLGWVSEKRVQTWGTRLCLEPNFAPEALAERKSTGTLSQAVRRRRTGRNVVVREDRQG